MTTSLTNHKLTDEFTVTKDINVFRVSEKKELILKICRIAWLVFSIIVFPIGIIRWSINRLTSLTCLPATFIFRKNHDHISLSSDEYRQAWATKVLFQKDQNENITFPVKTHQIFVTTADGVRLDTMMLQHPKQALLDTKDQKWIVYWGGNGMCYEQSLNDLKYISYFTGASIYTGNFRGVMDSEGSPYSSHDLVLDGEAMVQKLLASGVQSKNILLHGLSMGGGVATEVAALHQETGNEMHLCNDRSFATLTDAVKGMIPVVGGLLGGIAYLTGWRFDSVKNFENIKGHKFTIVSEVDEVIAYESSLYKVFKRNVKLRETDKKAYKDI